MVGISIIRCSYDFRYDKHPECGPGCDEVLHGVKGRYSAELITQRSEDIIREHNESKPLFLYIAYQSVHAPGEVPERYLAQYEGKIINKTRKKYAAMVSCLDEGIGNITRALKEK